MNGTQRHTQYKDSKVERAIKELDQYRAVCQRILRLKEQQLRMEENYCGIKAVDYAKLKVQGGVLKNELVETAIKWAELDVKIAKEKVERESIRFYLEGKMQSLPYEEQEVLTLYFINRLTVDVIALRMERSVETVKRLKKKALRDYAEVGV